MRFTTAASSSSATHAFVMLTRDRTTTTASALSRPSVNIFLTRLSPGSISHWSTQASTPSARSPCANGTTKRSLSSLACEMNTRGGTLSLTTAHCPHLHSGRHICTALKKSANPAVRKWTGVQDSSKAWRSDFMVGWRKTTASFQHMHGAVSPNSRRAYHAARCATATTAPGQIDAHSGGSARRGSAGFDHAAWVAMAVGLCW